MKRWGRQGWVTAVAAAAALGVVVGSQLQAQSMGRATAFVSAGGTEIRLLLDEATLGGAEVEVAEITFAPGTNSGDHVHGATEIFYVLSGQLEHIVNGKSYLLNEGEIGFVRPPDSVNHVTRAGEPPTKALVIWAPGGEAARIVERWKRQ